MPRVNINVSQELYDWYSERSKAIGTTMSGLMSTALYEYFESRMEFSVYELDALRRGSKREITEVQRGEQMTTKRGTSKFPHND